MVLKVYKKEKKKKKDGSECNPFFFSLSFSLFNICISIVAIVLVLLSEDKNKAI